MSERVQSAAREALHELTELQAELSKRDAATVADLMEKANQLRDDLLDLIHDGKAPPSGLVQSLHDLAALARNIARAD